jgi:hypothetical protein
MCMSGRRGGIAVISVAAIVLLLAVLSWNAGGPQELRPISQEVAVPELPQ